MGKAIYRRSGWQDKTCTIAHQDKTAGTVDLADDSGTTIVTSLPIFKEDPDPAESLSEWAVWEGSTSTGPAIDDSAVELIVSIATSGSSIAAAELEPLNKPTLAKIAGALGLANDSRTSKGDLIDLIRDFAAEHLAEGDEDLAADDLDPAGEEE